MKIQGLVGILFAALLAFLSPNISHANLIKNPGFETGTFSGWTQSGNLGFTSVTTSPFYVRSGTFGAFLGPIGSDGFLSQTFATVPGDVYIVSFSMRSDGGLPNDFNASWSGSPFFSQTNIPLGEYQTFAFKEVAQGPSTVLQFGFRNDPAFLGLDDVAVDPVNPTPEPTTMLLLGTTMAGLGLARWRQRKQKQATSIGQK